MGLGRGRQGLTGAHQLLLGAGLPQPHLRAPASVTQPGDMPCHRGMGGVFRPLAAAGRIGDVSWRRRRVRQGSGRSWSGSLGSGVWNAR